MSAARLSALLVQDLACAVVARYLECHNVSRAVQDGHLRAAIEALAAELRSQAIGFNVMRPSQHGEDPRLLQSFDTAEEAQEWIDALDPSDAAYMPYVEVA